MSYVVLARKYRPRRFDQMVGQAHVVQALGNALAQQRLHHAYLFTGTRGIGKTTVSRILAKSLNCVGEDGQGGVTPTPCGVCPACTAIDADRFVDYIELDAASNRSIEEVRDLIERAAYKPAVGRFKVFMIDEAHQLTKDAFNALLKTLEEPPEYLKFVLATTDPDKMLPTVLSRCLQFNLRPMPPELVQQHLADVLAREGLAIDDGALRLLGRAARGSMRDALSLTDQAIAYGAGRVDEATVRAMLGQTAPRQAAQVLHALAARDGAAVMQTVDQLRECGGSAQGLVDEVAELLQLAAVEQAVPGSIPDDDERSADARALAAGMAADEMQLVYSIMLRGRDELGLLADEVGALTMLLLRPLAFAPATSAGGSTPAPAQALRAPRPARSEASVSLNTQPGRGDEAAARPRAMAEEPGARERSLAAASQAQDPELAQGPHADVPSDEAEPVKAGDSGLGDRWFELVHRLMDEGHVSALVRELALQSALIRVDEDGKGEQWRLMTARESLRGEATVARLAEALGQLLPRGPRLHVIAGEAADTPAMRLAQARRQRQLQAEADIQNDPVVQELLAQFKGARIVPGSIKPR